MAENVKVIVRCRPMSKKERETNCKCVVRMKNCVIETWDPSEDPPLPKEFTFDSVYDQDSNTETIYNDICYPLIESTLEGYNSTIFVYGQTGCGKSFTMEGNRDVHSEKGIISRAFEHIFEAIAVTTGVKYLALVSYLEIYNEQIRDLLVCNDKMNNNTSLCLKETPCEGVTVPGLTIHPVHNVTECEQLLSIGSKNRIIGATLMNQTSSRSHTIFTISIEQISKVNNNESIRKGKLNLVDLAGSERQTKTGATGERLKEATKINLSLSALGNVISALVDGKAKHIPYRDSKLTRLLQDSLGGNTRTLMVACISPSHKDYAETLSTLRYANRAKNIHNKPKVNEDPKDAMLRKYQEEIERLRNQLENRQNTPPKSQETDNQNLSSSKTNDEHSKSSDLDAKRDQLIQDYQTEMQKLKNLHESEKSEKENVLKQIELIKREYETNIQRLNEEMKEKHEKRASKEEILQRIEVLKAAMIGGERAGDKELSERRKRKKLAAERRASAIAHVLAKIDMNEDRELLQNQYKDISDELKLKTDALRRYRHRVKLLQKEISDIQSEFETERQDYLETIRKQDRQIKLLKQISEKIAGILKKECNYRDLDSIKEQSLWIDETQKFKLPDVVVSRTKLPPAGRTTDIQTAPGRLESDSESFEDDIDKSFLTKHAIFLLHAAPSGQNHNRQSSNNSEINVTNNSTPTSPTWIEHDETMKFERTEKEDIIGNYFKPRRATELLHQSSKLEASNVINTWKGVHFADYTKRNKPKSTENLTARISNYSNNNGLNNLWINGNAIGTPEIKKPLRLEALPVIEKRSKQNGFHTLHIL